MAPPQAFQTNPYELETPSWEEIVEELVEFHMNLVSLKRAHSTGHGSVPISSRQTLMGLKQHLYR
jgi:hypothetical protein